MNDSVAIVVPVYNAERYLRNCIKSILNQTYKQIEVILIDDGSTDKSPQICDEFSAIYRNIHVLHQENKGSVEARKRGVLSSTAQEAKYIFLSDADDVLEKDAIELLYNLAKQYSADCVCGQMRRLWKFSKFKNKYVSPCFQNKEEKQYSNSEIMKELYVSCFGISNYPVNLVAKLYETKLITKAIEFDPIVKFMGEDLSVTLRCMPEIKKLVITPTYVYNYRIGGGTSSFMPYMLDDFLALYRYKRKLINIYNEIKDTRIYIDIELMNIMVSWLLMCYIEGKYSKIQLENEIKKVCAIEEIEDAALYMKNQNKENEISKQVINKEYDNIFQILEVKKKKTRLKRCIKNLLCRI